MPELAQTVVIRDSTGKPKVLAAGTDPGATDGAQVQNPAAWVGGVAPYPAPEEWEDRGEVTQDQLTAAITATVAELLDGAPGALDTLNELAAALNDDASFAATVTTALAGKVAKSDYDANTILAADVNDTPAALAVPASTFLGRKAAGGIAAMTPTEAKALLDAVLGGTYGPWFSQLNEIIVGAGGVASIDFQAIPQTYDDLLIEMVGRGDTAATAVALVAQFNGDAAANYDGQRLRGFGTTVAASESLGAGSAQVGELTGATADAGSPGAVSIRIPGYARTAFHKTLQSSYSNKRTTTSGNLHMGHHAGFWRSTAAITRVTLAPTAGNLVEGTRAVLYGLRG